MRLPSDTPTSELTTSTISFLQKFPGSWTSEMFPWFISQSPPPGARKSKMGFTRSESTRKFPLDMMYSRYGIDLLSQATFPGKNLEVGLKKEGLLYFVRELDGNDEEEYDIYLKDVSMYARVMLPPLLVTSTMESVTRAVVEQIKSTL
uniref:Uncharacterized protein n=1 Tax=Timema bartmani TaxID=61472 RepID=A0A7R9I300_9NEOP|nr:unnamed protein product [Timema bartmani]